MPQRINRKAVVSGHFYPSDKKELLSQLKSLFHPYASKDNYDEVQAIISPHAGYVFSGHVTADAFSTIDPNSNFNHIFILAPSHHHHFNGASIYNQGNYETPLGEIEVDIDIADSLINENKYLFFNNDAHLKEHSLEVQLPFIQYYFTETQKIIPIVCGTQKQDALKSIAKSLTPYFTSDNLFIISSDFSHFLNYESATAIDKNMAMAICKNSTQAVSEIIIENKAEESHYNSTTPCGISGIQILNYLTQNQSNYSYKLLNYQNSGDSGYGEKDRVVGYWAINVVHEKQFNLSGKEKNTLIYIAKNAIKNHLQSSKTENLSIEELTTKLKDNCGVFVSVYINKELRGCIGRFNPDIQLYKLTKQMALSAAFSDDRFSSITLDEINDLTVELSVLSPLKKIKNINEIEIGKHGIYIIDGFNKGTLLPQVATNNNWNVNEFLAYCSKHKAGLGWDGWKTADLFTYTALVFKG